MKRVLLVEDDQRVREVVHEGLSYGQFEVQSVSSAEEALELSLERHFDVYLLDIMLPGMDGLDCCRTLRQRGTRDPIIMITAKNEISDRVTGLDVGADDYIGKPFSLEELQARIRALLRKFEAYPVSFMKVGDLLIEPGQKRVSRAGTQIDLSRKEYALLELLARYQEKPVSREIISREVWESETGTYSNIIDVFMTHLRRKINVAGQEKLLHTIRGKGFLLGILPEPAPHEET